MSVFCEFSKKIFRTAFLQNTSEQLLFYVSFKYTDTKISVPKAATDWVVILVGEMSI